MIDESQYEHPICYSNMLGITDSKFIQYLKANNARFIGDKCNIEDLYTLSLKFCDDRVKEEDEPEYMNIINAAFGDPI